MAEFKLPELGENIASGTVTRLLVNVGDQVDKDQPVVELETEKAVVEVPSNIAGTVEEIRVKEGDTVAVGQVLLVLGERAVKTAAPQQAAAPSRKPTPTPPPPPVEKPIEPPPAAEEKPDETRVTAPAVGKALLAAPSARRLARELGVDLNEVPASSPGGRISPADIKAYAEKGKPPQTPAAAQPAAEIPAGIERDAFGEFERSPMSGIRKKTAQHISAAWETIPHVTQFDSADITRAEAFRNDYGKRAAAAGGKLTMTVLLMKVVAEALRKFKQFNAVVDMENEQIVLKRYINIGIAVDTPHGLIVPVVRDAGAKSLAQISAEVAALAERARTRKVTIEDLQGGTFTITNLGGIGGHGFTPIIKEPEVAILGVSRARTEPVWGVDKFEPRLMLPLSLSYDHRIIDGADAARFLRWVAEAVEQPWLMLVD